MSSRTGERNVVNVGHAVGRYERNALPKDVERWFETEDGSGALFVSSDPTRRVDAVTMSFESGEEFEPCDAWSMVVRQSPFVASNVISDLVEEVLVRTEGVAAFGNGLNAHDSGVKSISKSELGDVLFGDWWVLGEGVLEFEGVVLVLLDCE